MTPPETIGSAENSQQKDVDRADQNVMAGASGTTLRPEGLHVATCPPDRSCRAIFVPAAVLTVALEVLTCVLRFGCRLESTRDTASTIGWLTCGVRIHHGYVGAVGVLISCWLWERFPRTSKWLLITGLGLVASDMVHHFGVLWPVTGSPQFDLLYL